MDKDIMETVLTEILEEQKKSNLLASENIQVLVEHDKRLIAIDNKLDNKLLDPVPTDAKQVERLIAEGVNKITSIVADQPKQVIHQTRILLFPEHDAHGYYKIVFGRILGWLVLVLIATYLFMLGKEFIAAYQEKDYYRQAYEQLLKEKQENTHKIRQKTRVQDR